MEEMIETSISPVVVWSAWQKKIDQKEVGKFRYQILDVKTGESFSMLWKTMFVRLIFSHSVKPTARGSEIRYRVQIKGLFAWPVRWLLRKKMQSNLSLVLKAFARDLESH